MVFHLFHAMWPVGGVSPEVLAAIVNGPVANAFMSTQRTSRHNRIQMLKHIPIPRLRPEFILAIAGAVADYRSARLEWLAQPIRNETMEQRCRQALVHVDAELLTACDLPPRVERELPDYFAGYRRPGPIEFHGYYPVDFRSALPFRMFVSGDVESASAKQTLQRLPVLRDPTISEVVARLE